MIAAVRAELMGMNEFIEEQKENQTVSNEDMVAVNSQANHAVATLNDSDKLEYFRDAMSHLGSEIVKGTSNTA